MSWTLTSPEVEEARSDIQGPLWLRDELFALMGYEVLGLLFGL